MSPLIYIKIQDRLTGVDLLDLIGFRIVSLRDKSISERLRLGFRRVRGMAPTLEDNPNRGASGAKDRS